MYIQEYIDEITDMSSRGDYLKFELFDALQHQDIVRAVRYYNMLNETEEVIAQLSEIIEDFSSLN